MGILNAYLMPKVVAVKRSGENCRRRPKEGEVREGEMGMETCEGCRPAAVLLAAGADGGAK